MYLGQTFGFAGLDVLIKVNENFYPVVPFLSEELRRIILAGRLTKEATKDSLAFRSSSERLQFKAVTLSSIYHMHVCFAIQDDFLSCSTQSPWVFNRLTWIALGIADLLRNILQKLEEHFGQSKAIRANVVPSHILQYHSGNPVLVKGSSCWLKPWLRKAFRSPCLVPTRPYNSRRLNRLVVMERGPVDLC